MEPYNLLWKNGLQKNIRRSIDEIEEESVPPPPVPESDSIQPISETSNGEPTTKAEIPDDDKVTSVLHPIKLTSSSEPKQVGRHVRANSRFNVAVDEFNTEKDPGTEPKEKSVISHQKPAGDWESRAQSGPIPQGPQRETWTNQLDFLMTCISMSVGFGNIWRFPYIAYSNGGGAFLIPYMVVLFIVGRPMYYFELVVGQFTSEGCVKVWEMVPFFKGIGYAMALTSAFTVTYYSAIMALVWYYFFASFFPTLPWSQCQKDEYYKGSDLIDPLQVECYQISYNETISIFNYIPTVISDFEQDGIVPCPQVGVGSDIISNGSLSTSYCAEIVEYNQTDKYEIMFGNASTAELYYKYTVTRSLDNINDGIGMPEWKMTLCLLLTWLLIFGVLVRGIGGSGKVAWFTALFPYIVLIILFGRAVTLPNAIDGIKVFFIPELEKLLHLDVWFQAVQQCFFSLGMGFGAVLTFGSYNKFDHKIVNDVWIVSLMDTITSLIAGTITFGILGNLADGGDISKVVASGPNIAFVSYPAVLQDFKPYPLPQFFSVLFFFMMLTLGLGSGASYATCVIAVVQDEFPKCKRWVVVLCVCIICFFFGLIYCTPGGSFMLLLIDNFVSSICIYFIVLLELVVAVWIYGLRNLCNDITFMSKADVSMYWKMCWGVIIPVSLTLIMIYYFATFESPTVGNEPLPSGAMACGAALSTIILSIIPIVGIRVICTRKTHVKYKKCRASFHQSKAWGPKDPDVRAEWEAYKKTVPYRYHPWRMCRSNKNPSMAPSAIMEGPDNGVIDVTRKSELKSHMVEYEASHRDHLGYFVGQALAQKDKKLTSSPPRRQPIIARIIKRKESKEKKVSKGGNPNPNKE